MSASLNDSRPSLKVWRVFFFAAALLISAVSYQLFSRPTKDRLFEDLSSQLREENFAQIYEEADDFVHLNVTEERFVRRMKIAVSKLKAIDENLAFQRDVATENMFRRAQDDRDAVSITAYQKLEKDGKSVLVAFTWTKQGKLFDLWIKPKPGTSEEYEVMSVAAKQVSVGNQVLDW